MGIFRNIETSDGALGWSYSQFSHLARLVRESDFLGDDYDDYILESFLDFAEGKISKEHLIRIYKEYSLNGESFCGEEEGVTYIPWEICEDAEPVLRNIVLNDPDIGGHKDMAIALCDAMKKAGETRTPLQK